MDSDRKGHRAGLVLLKGSGDQTLRPEERRHTARGIAHAKAAKAEKSLRDCLEEGAGKEGKRVRSSRRPGARWEGAMGRQ